MTGDVSTKTWLRIAGPLDASSGFNSIGAAGQNPIRVTVPKKCALPSGKRLQKTMENHHVQWVNPLFLWPCSIAMFVYQMVFSFVGDGW